MRPQATSGASAPLPREHGAWGLLLQPFLAAAILAGTFRALPLLAAFCLVLAGFLIREPLIILLRLRKHGAADGYRKPALWLAGEAAVALASLVALAAADPVSLPALAALAVFGAAFTGLAVWMAVHNRQRSTLLQIAAVGGLSASAFAAVLASLGSIPEWAIWLWVIVTLHGVASVLCVHARLEARIAAAKSLRAEPELRFKASVATWLQAVVAILAVWFTEDRWQLAVPLLFSAAAHSWELQRIGSGGPEVLRERLQTVGFRMLAVSIAHTLLVIFSLWTMASP